MSSLGSFSREFKGPGSKLVVVLVDNLEFIDLFSTYTDSSFLSSVEKGSDDD